MRDERRPGELSDDVRPDCPRGTALTPFCARELLRHHAGDELLASTAPAWADSEPGSRNPPPDRLLTAGMPNTAVATMTNSAAAMTRRGAAMQICASADSK